MNSDTLLTGPGASLDLAPGTYFERFGVTREVMAKVLDAALSRGADDCDLFFEHALSTSVGLTDNQVNRASTNVDLGCGVRARNGDSVGYAYTEDLSLAALMSAATLLTVLSSAVFGNVRGAEIVTRNRQPSSRSVRM